MNPYRILTGVALSICLVGCAADASTQSAELGEETEQQEAGFTALAGSELFLQGKTAVTIYDHLELDVVQFGAANVKHFHRGQVEFYCAKWSETDAVCQVLLHDVEVKDLWGI